jgi:hypothetical protein
MATATKVFCLARQAELCQSGHSHVFSEMVLASNSQRTCQISKQRSRATRQGRVRPCCQQSPNRLVCCNLQLKGHPPSARLFNNLKKCRNLAKLLRPWKPIAQYYPTCAKTLAFYKQRGFAMKPAFPHYESTCAESPTPTNTNASNRNVGRSTLRFRVCRKSHAYHYKRSKS